MITEKNKFTMICLNITNENIKKNRKPIYNPIFLSGLTYEDRYNIFTDMFNLNDNIQMIDCRKIDLESNINTKILMIIENIEAITNNLLLQTKIFNMINEGLDKDIQIIICSNLDENELKLEDRLKSRLSWGIRLYLE